MYIDVNRNGVIRIQGQCDIHTHGTSIVYLDNICSHSLANITNLRRAAHKIALALRSFAAILVTGEERVFSQIPKRHTSAASSTNIIDFCWLYSLNSNTSPRITRNYRNQISILPVWKWVKMSPP
jgi:hypothetical protein